MYSSNPPVCRIRQSLAPHLFLGAYELESNSRKLVGYVCATQSPEEHFTHASMTSHVPGSSSVCIHSVCVSPFYRGKGLGQALLKEYLARLEAARSDGTATWERVILIAHDHLVPFYEKAGFENLGRSNVVHGSLSWFEVRRLLTTPLKSVEESPTQVLEGHQQMPPGVLEALRRPRAAPSSKLVTDFPNGFPELIQSSAATGISTNKFDLLCPRGDCGSIILKKGVGKWVERASVQVNIILASNPKYLVTDILILFRWNQ
jgi:GNAT superfamily N-acetyltransferase